MTNTVDSQTLSAYVDGELTPDEVKRVESALDRNETLRSELEDLRAVDKLTSDALASLLAEPVPLAVATDVQERLAAKQSQPSTQLRGGAGVKSWQMNVAASLLAASIAAIAAFGAGWHLSNQRHQTQVANLEEQLMADREAFAVVVADTLERQLSGEQVVWQNPVTGNAGTVTPVRTFRNTSGEWCREYREDVSLGGERSSRHAIACRSNDGTWDTRAVALNET